MADDNLEAIIRSLLPLISEMTQGKNLPSPYRDDWPDRIKFKEIERRATATQEQVKDWTMRLRVHYKLLREYGNTSGKT